MVKSKMCNKVGACSTYSHNIYYPRSKLIMHHCHRTTEERTDQSDPTRRLLERVDEKASAATI